MAGEKRRRRTVTEIRREAISDVLIYLAYRATVCREGLEQAVTRTGVSSRGAATERSAMFEAELIERDVQTILDAQGDRGDLGRELKANLATWARYVANRPTQSQRGKAETVSTPAPTQQTGEGQR